MLRLHFVVRNFVSFSLHRRPQWKKKNTRCNSDVSKGNKICSPFPYCCNNNEANIKRPHDDGTSSLVMKK
uniref:Uncharacterized protein n=1 Tax=Anguilla anguilla TaxID=7936 RepID=A0A0E9T5C0_ANGAN